MRHRDAANTAQIHAPSEAHMFDFRKISLFLATAILVAQPLLAAPRLVPQGSVKMIDSGIVVDKEMPVPAGMLMACTGQCYIEANGLQLMGSDKTVFAVHEEAELFSVMVQEGTVDFALRADSKPVEFKTPFDSMTGKPYLIPASTDSVVRGTLQVSDDKAVLTMTQGSLELTNAQGQKLVHAGSAIVLAQAVTDGANTSGTAGTGLTTTQIVTGAVAVGAVAAGAIAIGSSSGGSGDSDGVEASPFAPMP
jgi:hypothetical protein